MNGKETEIKLALNPADMERLRRHGFVRETSLGRAQTRNLSSVYYDTPDFSLFRAGITVRLRHGGQTVRQTVKTRGHQAGGLFTRPEWESPVAGDGLDETMLRATGLDLLQDPALPARLVPVFRSTIRRRLYHLACDRWEVDMALDVGEVQAADGSAPISEVEFELVSGTPADLFTLARRLTTHFPTRLEPRSKAERGFALAIGQQPAPSKAPPVRLTPQDSVGTAFQTIARNCLSHFQINESCLSQTGDGEALHQMRVALRRLRSAIRLFHPILAAPDLSALEPELRWLLSVLGPARDMDVLLDNTLTPAGAGLDDDQLHLLRGHWKGLRDESFERMGQALTSSRHTALLLDLGAWIEVGDWLDGDAPAALRRDQPVITHARTQLDKCTQRLRKGGGKHLDRLSPESRHRVRILGKRLRYAGEFFAPLFGDAKTKPFLSTLARLQDCLGELNDQAVARTMLGQSMAIPALTWSAGHITGWQESHQAALLAEASQCWAEWRDQKPFWD